MTTFGPRPMLWVLALVGLCLLVAFFLTGREYLWLPVLGGLVLLLTLPGWNRYRLDAEGIHRVGIRGRKDVPWDAVEGVVNRSGTPDRFGEEVITQFVVDPRGRPLLRLDAWVGRRGHLVRLVLATVRARREEAGRTDPVSTGAAR